jgi:hypothetical protein
VARKKAALKVVDPPSPLRLDIGCGTNKKEGFIGIDVIKFDGVDLVLNAGDQKWPYADASVEEIHASHFVEHLTPKQRIHFVNESYRVLRPFGKLSIIVPHWCASRAYGDLTHVWPPVSEFWFYYLNAEWRKTNAPHNLDYTCDFDHSTGYSLHPMTNGRSQDFINFATQAYKEVCQDIQATLIKTERRNLPPKK